MVRRPSTTYSSPDQPSFFDVRSGAPLGDLDAVVREALGETLTLAKARHAMDRHDVAAEINRLQPSDRELTKNMLDRCSAPSASDWQLPAWRVPALCRVTEDFRLLTVLVEACGHKAVPSEAAAIAELVMVELEQKRLRDQSKAIRKGLSPAALDWATRELAGRDGR